jgi:hypothetical protein
MFALLALAAAGCGGSKHRPLHGAAAVGRSAITSCVSVSKPAQPGAGYWICGRGPRGGSGRSTLMHGATVTAQPIDKGGHWEKAFVSPDARTVLAQWSGECEQQRTFFIPAGGGKPRVVTGEHDWMKSPESEAIGWRGSHALVRLRGAGETAARRPGVYLVDPRTFHRTLTAPTKRSFAC